MRKSELLKEIDNRLHEILKYYDVLEDKYKLNVLKDIKNKIRIIIESGE